MNRIIACMIAGGAMICAAPAFANDTNRSDTSSASEGTTNSSPTMTNSHALHKKLMKDCMEQQRSQGSGSDTSSKKNCEAQVRDQMQQMNKAGTVPPASVPQRSGSADSHASTSGTSDGASSSSTEAGR